MSQIQLDKQKSLQAVDEQIAMDRIRVIECRKINNKISKEILTVEQQAEYCYYLNILLNQIENSRLQKELRRQLFHKQMKSENNIIPIQLCYKKRATSSVHV